MKNLLQTLFFFLLVTQICFAQWYQQNSPTTKNLYAVQFIDANNGWAVGDSGTILHTTNAGTNWEQKISGTILQLNDAFFINESKGWIVGGPWPGYGNVLLHTTDAGINWIQQITDTSLSLNSIFFLNESVGWIAGAIYADSGYNNNEFPIILKTTDGGSNWHLKSIIIDPQYGLILNDVFFIDANIGFAVGGRGNIGCLYGSIFKTTNGGESWSEQLADPDSITWWQAISFSDELNGIAVGIGGCLFAQTGEIYHTIDGGTNWISVYDGGLLSINDITIFDSENVWVVGAGGYWIDGTILFSNDMGSSWTNQGIFPYWLNSVFFINSLNGWAVGDNGTILHTTNGGVTFVEEEQIDEMPTEFLLSNNFPNPFNPSTKIKYSVPQTLQVQIKVFDILGNELETLVNEEKPAGTYEITWNAEQLPSGVYFYQLKAEEYTAVKKMILIK